MIWLIFLLSGTNANPARPDNWYLPPPNAKDAGGHGDDLEVPLEPPYIDSYSDNRHLFPYGGQDDQPNFGYRRLNDGYFPYGPRARFLYGSYTFTGPDDTLFTITYSGNKNKWNIGRSDNNGNCETVLVPPSLPEYLERALASYRKKFQRNTEKAPEWKNFAIGTSVQGLADFGAGFQSRGNN